MKIVRATINELNEVGELFNQYRMFYQQASDIAGAKEFLRERISNEESTIFLALEDDVPVGFTQLYPTFSSVSMKRSLILNDLFVVENARRLGVGRALIETAFAFAKETQAKGVLLETGNDNHKAQALYEKMGFTREENYFYYYGV